MRKNWDLYAIAAWLTLGLILQQRLTEGITSDGALYFAHLRSLLFDGDLDITRELQILNLPPREHHVVPLGPTILWAPFYLLVWAVDASARALGAWATPSDTSFLGLTPLYRQAAIVASYLAAAAGLIALHLRLRAEFGARVAVLTTLLVSGATPLAWYMIYEPSLPHAASFGAAALLTAASVEWLLNAGTLTSRRALAIGALLGAVATIRTQDAVFGAIPVLAGLEAVRRGTLRIRTTHLAWIAAGLAPFLIAQAVMLLALLPGQQFALTGEQAGYLRPSLDHLFDVLFSSWYGLFTWTPLAYLAVIGMAFYAARQPYLGTAGAIVFLGTWLANGLAHDWHGSWAFGARRFVSALVVLAPGLALALEFFFRRPMIVASALVTAAIAWHAALMVQFHTHVIPRETAVRFDTLLREPANWWIPRLARFYPFAFPHNLWFAMTQGLPLERYDQLGYEPFSSRYRLVMDVGSDRYLLEGWSEESLGEGGLEHRTVNGPAATMVLPVRPLEGRPVRLEVEGYVTTADGAPAVIDIEVNDQPVGSIELEHNMTTRAILVPADLVGKVWRTGLNRIRLLRRGEGALAIHAITAEPG
jgi:hypothetical protein